MKLRILNILLASLLYCFMQVQAQGKYAGTQKKLIGKTYTNEKHIEGLKGFDFRQGDMITAIDDAEPQFLTIYVKGTKAVVVYSAQADTSIKKYSIIDVIEINNLLPGWEIKTAGCNEGATEEEIIIALVKPGKKQYATTIKQAWLCERDRLRIEAISTKNVKCLNEGTDNE